MRIRARSARVRPQVCPKFWSRSAKSSRLRANIGKIWTTLVQHRPNLRVKFGRFPTTKFGRACSELGRFGSDPAQTGPNLSRLRSKLGQFRTIWAKSDRSRTIVGHARSNVERGWSTICRNRQKLDRRWSDLGRCRARFGQHQPRWTDLGPKLANTRPKSAKLGQNRPNCFDRFRHYFSQIWAV